ncbi:MAG: hypothetical protein EZS28_014682 [Streblomastix strix]|uniref:Uncharacterized protein n=1 Tax=Streblomastix strix TaxID=222440 RepID=A0A5J4W5H3_9EUKA|nr:MAG: hypothetical protein EZS28_014682 [Streblomastix strix]
MAIGVFSKIRQLVQKIGKGLQQANDYVYKPFKKLFAKPILGALDPVGKTIGKGFDVASSFLDYGYSADKNDSGSSDNAQFDADVLMKLSMIQIL